MRQTVSGWGMGITIRPMVIGLCGAAGAGKSSVARILDREHDFARRPFAFNLKAMLHALGVPVDVLHALGVPVDVLDGSPEVKEQPLDILAGRSCRHAMQTLGTEWGRHLMADDFWVRLWEAKAAGLPRIVADDVRFDNEVAAIRRLGGVIVRVCRQGAGTTSNAGHASERMAALAQPDVDITLHNDGSPDDLRWMVAGIVERLNERRAA